MTRLSTRQRGVNKLDSTLSLASMIDSIPTWVEGAECGADPDAWFSDDPLDKLEAKAACLRCPFRRECQEYGESQSFGIYGGIDQGERNAFVSVDMREDRDGDAMRARRAAAIELRRTEGLSPRKIAARLGITYAAARYAIRDAA